MKIFITATFKGRDNKSEIEKICDIVKRAGFEDFCFIRDIENYQKTFTDPKELMNRAKEEIKKCDGLLIDLTEKPTGRAIEAGMAYGFGKKVIAIMKQGTAIKETVRGIADVIIGYNESIEEILPRLRELSRSWSDVHGEVGGSP